MPTQSTPNEPPTPWTEMAPTGSSMPRFSKKPMASMTITAATMPMTRGGPRLHEGARRRDRDQAGEHAVGHHPGIGLARRGPRSSTCRPWRRTQQRWPCSPRRRRSGGPSPQGGCGVEAEPAEQQDERAEHGHRDVVAGEGAGLAVRAVLAEARPEDDGARAGSGTAHGVHHAGAGEVHVAEARADGCCRAG